jgi:peptide deformylase
MLKLLKENDPLLTQRLEPFEFTSDVDPAALEAEMTKLMQDNYGMGIAANQVGFDRRVIIVQPKGKDPIGMFNP